MLPEPASHVNQSIVTFLNHFKSERLIKVECADPDKDGRKRTDEEKETMNADNQTRREEEKAQQEKYLQDTADMVQKRDSYKTTIFELVAKGRTAYKEKLMTRMDQRNSYREMISNRLDKQRALLELLAAEKIDLAALQTAIDQAVENLVKQDIIARANKQLEALKYAKEVEAQLQAAVAEKVKENLLAVLEKIERENIQVEPKMLNDAKNVLNKLK